MNSFFPNWFIEQKWKQKREKNGLIAILSSDSTEQLPNIGFHCVERGQS